MQTTITIVRKILATPLYLLSMFVGLAILAPMQLVARALMVGTLGGQRHIYYPIVLGQRLVAGKPRWRPEDYFSLGIAPRTPAEEAELKAHFERRTLTSNHAMPLPVIPELPADSWGCLTCGDHGYTQASKAAHDTQCQPYRLYPGQHASYMKLREAASRRGLACLEYRFVPTTYEHHEAPWALVTDDRIADSIDATHAMINALGGINGVMQSRRTQETPDLIVVASISDAVGLTVEGAAPLAPPFH